MDNHIDREKLRQALEQVRKDIASLHRDLAYAAADRVKLITFIIYLVLAQFLQSVLGINILWCFLISVFAVSIHLFYWEVQVRRRVRRLLDEPLEPMWDTTVDL